MCSCTWLLTTNKKHLWHNWIYCTGANHLSCCISSAITSMSVMLFACCYLYEKQIHSEYSELAASRPSSLYCTVRVHLCVCAPASSSLLCAVCYFLTFKPRRCGCTRPRLPDIYCTCSRDTTALTKYNYKITRRHWPGPGAGSHHSPSFLPLPLPQRLAFSVPQVRTMPGGQLWLEQECKHVVKRAQPTVWRKGEEKMWG